VLDSRRQEASALSNVLKPAQRPSEEMQLSTSPGGGTSVGLRSRVLQKQGVVFFYPLKPHDDGPSRWGGLGTVGERVPRYLSLYGGTVQSVHLV
jgi:hypothetical protein